MKYIYKSHFHFLLLSLLVICKATSSCDFVSPHFRQKDATLRSCKSRGSSKSSQTFGQMVIPTKLFHFCPTKLEKDTTTLQIAKIAQLSFSLFFFHWCGYLRCPVIIVANELLLSRNDIEISQRFLTPFFLFQTLY